MPFVHVTWLPKAVRADPKVRQAVAGAIIKALTAPDIAAKADIPTDKLVVRFSEAVDGFPVPEGHTYESLGLKDEK